MKKKIKIKIFPLLMSFVLSFTVILTGCTEKGSTDNDPEPTDEAEQMDTGEDYMGLYVAEDGYIYLGGTKFYGYGLNFYSTFQDALSSVNSKGLYMYDYSLKRSEAYVADFQFANLYDIPVVRIPFSSWGIEAYNKFEKDPDAFFEVMDKVVLEAEKKHVGIIASLMWNQDTMASLVGEKRSEFGNTESELLKYAKKYVSAIVERYKDSPAIWGWEIGNEYNLSADLQAQSTVFPVGEANYYDWYTSDELVVFYEEIGKTIREIDPNRIITTGNGENRTFSYAAHNSALNRTADHYYEIDWTLDTREQFMEMCAYFTPDPLDTICFHFQHGTLNAADGSASLTMTHNLKDETLTTAEYIKLYVEAGRKVNKGVYFGEFGDFIDIENEDRSDFNRELFEESFKILMDGMIDADLQLATGWFNWTSSSGRFNHTQYNLSEINEFKMNLLKEINDNFQSEGKQNLEAYWSKYPCDGSSFLTK